MHSQKYLTKRTPKPSSVNGLQVSCGLYPVVLMSFPPTGDVKRVCLKTATASTFKHGLLAFWKISKMAPMATLSRESQYLYKRSLSSFNCRFENESLIKNNTQKIDGCVRIKIFTAKSWPVRHQELLTQMAIMRFYTQNGFQKPFVQFDYLVTALQWPSGAVGSDRLSFLTLL